MRLGVTNLFKGSAFSGALPQVALNIATALRSAGHDVYFVLPSESDDWFSDCSGCNTIPSIKLTEGASIEMFDLVIEVVWFLPEQLRAQITRKAVMFYHYPPAFYDIESSTYPLAALTRDFTGLAAIWTWAHYKHTDYSYLEFISRKPVFKCPFFWDPQLIDAYIKESDVPAWKIGSKKIAICESNQSNTSNCTLPMVIASEIYKNDPLQKWSVLNSEDLSKREFFINNLVKNLHLGLTQVDISGNFMKRVRLPDLCRESNYIIAHQRFRPIKYMLLDALYLGIPLIHNCEMIKDTLGGQWFYELNRIGQALTCWKRITVEMRPDLEQVRAELDAKWGPNVGAGAMNGLIECVMNWVPSVAAASAFKLAFLDMWADFQPGHNLFLEAFTQNGFNVVNDQNDPNLIIFGPFSSENKHEKWANVPKIFYTGENLPPVVRDDVLLNVGFSRISDDKYMRIPNWVLELNWYNQKPELVKNPMPFPISMLNEPVAIREKFCIFVASNPTCFSRNTLFNVVSRYKHVDSAGMLFNNCSQIACGPGGSNGQVAKVEAYRAYKFALVCENSSVSGYTTEKLLHAKLAGCIPIYWGDPDVGLDFDKESFLNVSDYNNVDELLSAIKMLDCDPAKWLNMASKPLFLPGTIEKTRAALTNFCKTAFNLKLAGAQISSNISNIANGAQPSKIEPYTIVQIKTVDPRVIVTCCNGRFVDSAIRLIKSSKDAVYVWVWDIDFDDAKRLLAAGAKKVTPLDTKWNPQWADFWNPAHYAWKPLVMVLANSVLPAGTQVLYLDSGIEIVNSLDSIWAHIETDGFFICKMPEHKMVTWCHPKFCSILVVNGAEMESAQVSANIVGFVVGQTQASQILSQTLGLACNSDIIAGKKWHRYSDVCMGHRHDQSILSLMCIRANVNMHLLDSFAEYKSYDDAVTKGCALYTHRGNWKQSQDTSGRAINNIGDCYVVNLEHRKDRLAQFMSNHPYLESFSKQFIAVYGRELILDQTIYNLFKNNDFKWKKSVMGCALSHYDLWKRTSQSIGNCLVLEDDALLVPDFVAKWNHISNLMPADADIVFLGGVLPPNKAILPMITEQVNEAFAKVKVNEYFGSKRRYFHFCTYSYIITPTGAKKMCGLIGEKGLFTSADHMLVNNMDLLNVYFTTPLLAGCIQDNDPVYQKADFNNYNRIDKFDSEIWNNTEVFSQEALSAYANNLEKLTVVYFEKEQYKQCIDSQWLGEIFQRTFVWKHFTDSFTAGEKVLVYYQHTTDVSLITGWINRNSDCYIYLLHASDESCKADVSLYAHPSVKCVFRNYWRPECVAAKVIHLPLGYLNNKGGTGKVIVSSQRPLDWSFAGAMDRNNRLEIIEQLKKRFVKHKVHLTPTWGSSANLEADKYLSMLNESRFVPCLDGFSNCESYRFYEALEAGCLPIICTDEKRSYENILCSVPLCSVKSWSDSILYDWDCKQKEILYAWANYKMNLAKLITSKLQ